MGTQHRPCHEHTTNNSVRVMTNKFKGTYVVLLLVEHEGRNSPAGVGPITSLTADTDSGTAPAILILGARNGMGRHWHDENNDEKWR